MRVVFLINSLEGGGAERVLCRLASHLAATGHEPVIVTLMPARPAYPLSSGVPVRELAGDPFLGGVGQLLLLPLLAARFRRAVAEIRPDAVVSFLVRANLVNMLSAIGGRSIPTILSERVQAREHYSGILLWPMRALISAFYPRANAVIAISDSVRESLLLLGVAPEKIHVIYNPVDPEGIVPRAGRSPLLDQRVVQLITVGRLVDFKEQKMLIRALPRIREQCDARLTLVGDGPLRNDLENRARELGVAPFVTITGWTSNPFPLLAAGDIFVFSSRYEGFGNVILEAMACGVPIVSTDCPGAPREIVRDGRDGILVPVGDSDALARRVVELVDDPALYERLRIGGLARVHDFGVPAVAESYLRVLRDVGAGKDAD
jgi:glycosyltransferase involved in cell wall biosynthesis